MRLPSVSASLSRIFVAQPVEGLGLAGVLGQLVVERGDLLLARFLDADVQVDVAAGQLSAATPSAGSV